MFDENDITKYFKVIAKMTSAEKAFLLQEALNINGEEALQKICEEMQKQELLLKLAKTKQREKITPENLEKIEKLKLLKVQRVKKRRKNTKREIIKKRYFWKIKELREKENLSWRQIAEYLKKNNKFQISFVMLKKVYEELEFERKDER